LKIFSTKSRNTKLIYFILFIIAFLKSFILLNNLIMVVVIDLKLY